MSDGMEAVWYCGENINPHQGCKGPGGAQGGEKRTDPRALHKRAKLPVHSYECRSTLRHHYYRHAPTRGFLPASSLAHQHTFPHGLGQNATLAYSISKGG